jgi:hypothetical protein
MPRKSINGAIRYALPELRPALAVDCRRVAAD